MSKLPQDPVPELTPISALEPLPQMSASQLQQCILQLLNTSLSEKSLQRMQDQLHFLHKCSFYLELRQDEPSWALIDQHRLEGALNLAHTQVRLLLALLQMLLEEVVCSRQDLEAFLVHCDQGSVDLQLLQATQLTLVQVREHLLDFDTRLARNLGPLDLENQLVHTGSTPGPQLCVSLSLRPPVLFDWQKSHAKSTSVHLVWTLPSGHAQEPQQPFEVQMRILHPVVAEQGQYSQYIFQSYSCTLENLTPNRVYQFAVKRADSPDLVYSSWMDTLMIKTLDV